ncbi:MAG: glycerol-3-phosphate 1-O-acyltransferase PlsY [Candidatus Cloacimonadaceae bacterium]
MTQLMPYLSLVIAYLLGSLPTSYLIGRIFYGTDIRETGSGNTGATNALRTFGPKIGIIVLIVDVLKGVAAILIARYLMRNASAGASFNLIESLSGLFVILGHVYSVWLKFKGGKGVATAAGVFLTLMPLPVLFCLVLFGYIVYTTKYVSLGSVLAVISLFIIELVTQIIMKFHNTPRLFLVLIIAALIIYRHGSNLKRLLSGSENKIKFAEKQEQEI